MVGAWYYNLCIPICPVVLSEFVFIIIPICSVVLSELEKMWKYAGYSFFHPGFVTLTVGKDPPFRGKIETKGGFFPF